jgi:sortase A
MRRVLGNLLVILGIVSLSLGLFFYWQRVSPRRISFDVENLGSPRQKQNDTFPTGLVISDLDISLPIFPAQVQNGRWEATTKGASYLISTPIPGEMGNSVIYGHNWESLLGNLIKAQPGQEIIVYYSDGSELTFKVTHTQLVSPSQTKILDQTNDRRITLYTCTGFLDSKRFVVTAILQGYHLGYTF